ncbi:MAG: helix-turn-helix domain-containing protein [Actinomycetota bacterium]
MDWREVDTTHCGVSAAADIVGDRWSLLVLRDVFAGVSRFGDLQRHVGLSSAVLTDRLDRLVDAEVLTRVEYRDDGARGRREYQLTERGVGLLHVIVSFAEFGYDELIADEDRLVTYSDRASGQSVRLALVRDDGTEVSPLDLHMHVNEKALP